MDRKRERYNARARQSAAGGSSHKRRKRRNATGPTGGGTAEVSSAVIPDPNAEIISLKPFEQKELERKERVKQQVRVLFHSTDVLVIQYHLIRSLLDGDRRRYELFKKKEKEIEKIHRAH